MKSLKSLKEDKEFFLLKPRITLIARINGIFATEDTEKSF
jgi:hypothetical protein